jgi:cytochrome bd-type quinol oxidase subunit 2
MKNAIIILFLAVLGLSPIVVHGELSQDCTGAVSTTLCNPIRYSGDDIGTFLTRIVGIFTGFFAVTALIMVVFSGFRMLVSQGEAESLTAAKDSLKWSVLGLILSMFAFAIVTAIGTFLGMKDIGPGDYTGDVKVLNPLLSETTMELIPKVLTGFLSITGIIALLMIMVSGFKYVTASGNEEQVESAKNTLQWAIGGLVVILLAYVLVRATLTFFDLKPFNP